MTLAPNDDAYDDDDDDVLLSYLPSYRWKGCLGKGRLPQVKYCAHASLFFSIPRLSIIYLIAFTFLHLDGKHGREARWSRMKSGRDAR